jgi:hypothetical protein
MPTSIPIVSITNTVIAPSILVDEVTTNYIVKSIDQDGSPTALDIVFDGSFLVRAKMLTLPSAPIANRTAVIRWPAFWFDIYIGDAAAPTEGIDGYDLRSAATAPVEHLAVMLPADGMLGFYSPSADLWPDKTQPHAITLSALTVHTTDAGILTKVTGAGSVNFYIKPRMSAVVQSINGGDFAAPGNTLILTETYEGFIGNATITITT